jgi:hypothetical protein
MPARISAVTCVSAAAGSGANGATWSRRPAAVNAGLIASVTVTMSAVPPTPISSRRFRNMSRMIMFGV